MKKFVLLSVLSVACFAQEPQWTGVAHVVTFNQTAAIPTTNLFTPPQDGIYRVTIYFSVLGSSAQPGMFASTLTGQDVSGAFIYRIPFTCTVPQRATFGPITYDLKAGQPITYAVAAAGAGCTYDLAISVEQFQ